MIFQNIIFIIISFRNNLPVPVLPLNRNWEVVSKTDYYEGQNRNWEVVSKTDYYEQKQLLY